MAGKLEKATHQDATDFEGPVDTGDAHAKRPADKKGVGDLEPDTSVSKKDPGSVFPSGKVNEEEIKNLFKGVEGLSEDFSSRAAVLIEGAMSEKIHELKEAYEAHYATLLESEVEKLTESYEEKLDAYLDYVVENFMKENQVAIEEGIKNDIAEQVMESVATIIESNGYKLPEGKVDVAEALAEEVRDTEKKLNEQIEENIALKQQVEKYQLKEAVAELSADLSDASKEKLAKLSENISYNNIDDFKSKVGVLKESLGITPAKVVNETITEEVHLGKEKVVTEHDEKMKAYIRALRGED